MPNMVLNRTFTLTTLRGHSISFTANTPVHVPPDVFADAVAIGAQLADGGAPDILPPQKNDRAPDPNDRAPLILAAIEEIVTGNERKDFTSGGIPSVKAVERVAGFDVDAKEVAVVWQQYHDAKAGK